MTNKFGKISALREHMLDGHKVSRLESMVMFGVSNLPVIVSGMKKKGFLIKSQKNWIEWISYLIYSFTKKSEQNE